MIVLPKVRITWDVTVVPKVCVAFFHKCHTVDLLAQNDPQSHRSALSAVADLLPNKTRTAAFGNS